MNRQILWGEHEGHYGGLLGDEPLSWTTAPVLTGFLSSNYNHGFQPLLKHDCRDGFDFATILSNKVRTN